jgi:hypothetical protein
MNDEDRAVIAAYRQHKKARGPRSFAEIGVTIMILLGILALLGSGASVLSDLARVVGP